MCPVFLLSFKKEENAVVIYHAIISVKPHERDLWNEAQYVTGVSNFTYHFSNEYCLCGKIIITNPL